MRITSALSIVFALLGWNVSSAFSWSTQLRPSSSSSLLSTISRGHQVITARRKPSTSSTNLYQAPFSVSVDELEKDLTDAERTVTGVVRKASPAVALITSVLPPPSNANSPRSRRQQRQQRQQRQPPDDSSSNNRPRGQSLGSGSGFVVNSQGYIVTNFHVIERAYSILETKQQIYEFRDSLVGNLTSVMIPQQLPISNELLANKSVNLLMEPLLSAVAQSPKIYVKIAGQEKKNEFLECRVVDVKPNLDVALLKVISSNNTSGDNDDSNNNNNFRTVQFGSSTDLIVGQTVVAIGNPFGLDSSVSVGVVSALDREIRTQTSTTKGCIQTDAAINPGNSGGPLLNLQQQVVGVNTAIVSASGSSSGVGFAVPATEVAPVITDMIRVDQRKNPSGRRKRGYLGVQCWKTTESSNTTVVVGIDEQSPAFGRIAPLQIEQSTGCIVQGDRIIGVAGNPISSWTELERELSTRRTGEEVAITLQSVVDPSDQRIVTLKLQ